MELPSKPNCHYLDPPPTDRQVCQVLRSSPITHERRSCAIGSPQQNPGFTFGLVANRAGCESVQLMQYGAY